MGWPQGHGVSFTWRLHPANGAAGNNGLPTRSCCPSGWAPKKATRKEPTTNKPLEKINKKQASMASKNDSQFFHKNKTKTQQTTNKQASHLFARSSPRLPLPQQLLTPPNIGGLFPWFSPQNCWRSTSCSQVTPTTPRPQFDWLAPLRVSRMISLDSMKIEMKQAHHNLENSPGKIIIKPSIW